MGSCLESELTICVLRPYLVVLTPAFCGAAFTPNSHLTHPITYSHARSVSSRRRRLRSASTGSPLRSPPPPPPLPPQRLPLRRHPVTPPQVGVGSAPTTKSPLIWECLTQAPTNRITRWGWRSVKPFGRQWRGRARVYKQIDGKETRVCGWALRSPRVGGGRPRTESAFRARSFSTTKDHPPRPTTSKGPSRTHCLLRLERKFLNKTSLVCPSRLIHPPLLGRSIHEP